jgi:type IV secretory pathway protease TraF
MKIDLNFDLLGLDGLSVLDLSGKTINAGKVIANSLVQQSKGDALKFWDWAVALNKGEVLDLDSSDQETFKNFVKDNEGLPIITKAQILHKLKKE